MHVNLRYHTRYPGEYTYYIHTYIYEYCKLKEKKLKKGKRTNVVFVKTEGAIPLQIVQTI